MTFFGRVLDSSRWPTAGPLDRKRRPDLVLAALTGQWWVAALAVPSVGSAMAFEKSGRARLRTGNTMRERSFHPR